VLHPDEPCGDLVNLENQVGYLRAVGNASGPTRIPFHLLLVQLCGRLVSHRVEHVFPILLPRPGVVFGP
jgi:hypothetical protein